MLVKQPWMYRWDAYTPCATAKGKRWARFHHPRVESGIGSLPVQARSKLDIKNLSKVKQVSWLFAAVHGIDGVVS